MQLNEWKASNFRVFDSVHALKFVIPQCLGRVLAPIHYAPDL